MVPLRAEGIRIATDPWSRQRRFPDSRTRPRGTGLRLERFTNLLNRKGFRIWGEYDSRCWLGWRQHPMVRPISNDLRKRAVSAVAKGESCRSVAERFGVAVSSVVKWSQRYRTTGSVAPGKMGGHRKPVLDPHRAFIVERVT